MTPWELICEILGYFGHTNHSTTESKKQSKVNAENFAIGTIWDKTLIPWEHLSGRTAEENQVLPLLILELFLLMFLLTVDGEPLRFLLLRRLKFVSDLDTVQIIILDIYLGGFILYVIAMLPLHLFSWPILLGFTVASLLFSIAIHFKTLNHFSSLTRVKASLKQNRKVSLEYVAVFAMLVIFLLINLASLSGFVFGSVHDESIHSLTVEVILENKQVPFTLQPYLAEGIIYPQASHVIFAFASNMLNMGPPEAVLYGSILFKSLTILGAYFLGKKLSSRRAYYLGLSFVFAFVSSWPLFITWGANPFIVGLPLFLLSLGLLFPMIQNHEGNSLAELVTIGLLLGYCGALIISYLETLIVTAILISAYWVIKKQEYLRRHLSELLVVFLVSLLPLSPFLFRFFALYQYHGHNIGIPPDFLGYPTAQFYATQALQWTAENLSPYFWPSVFIISLVVGLAVLIWKTKDYEDIKPQTAFVLAIFAASALLSVVSFFLPADFNVISWGHQGILMIVAINMIILIFYVRLNDLCRQRKLKSLAKIFSKDAYSGAMLVFMVLLLINIPFIYTRLVVDPQTLTGAYGSYAITTEGDRDLMLWMKANLTSDAVILVNPNDAGLFIPAVSHQKIVFPWTGSSLARSYQTLVNLTLDHVLNQTSYELMQEYNITHVFIGGAATEWWAGDFAWDPLLFLGNPNFKLIENFGNSYLFQFNYAYPNVAFFDDFEYANWSTNGWKANSTGSGQGNVSIANFGYDSHRSLNITAQAAYTASELQYATYVWRKIFVPNDSDVGLSFYLNAIEGFSGKDTFAAVVSNLYGNQTIVIATPNGVYENYQYKQDLAISEGFFEFEGNSSLSNLWRKAYHSSLPNPFVLEFVDWDFDGVKNVAYLDDVNVTTTPAQ